MFQPMLAQGLAVLSALLALAASAQTPATPARAPTASAATQATPGEYRSAFEGYQPFSENKMVPWREANDTVGQIGGWRAYAKEAAGVPKPAASRAKP